MRVLIACEFSGRVREAFRREGHDAWSCDLVPSESPGQHYQMDVTSLLSPKWDLLIAFPPCTYLASSGARWFKFRRELQREAITFARMLLRAPIPHVALENPIGVLSSHISKPTQIIQPWQFGHGETKATCLWLRNLPKLEPTSIVAGREARIHKMPPSATRAKDRSRTYAGIAQAMAQQWGAVE